MTRIIAGIISAIGKFLILTIRKPVAKIRNPPQALKSLIIAGVVSGKMTAGMFSILAIVLIPIPIEHNPKIMVRSALNFGLSLCPAAVPKIPPITTDNALMITPTGLFSLPLIPLIVVQTMSDDIPYRTPLLYIFCHVKY